MRRLLLALAAALSAIRSAIPDRLAERFPEGNRPMAALSPEFLLTAFVVCLTPVIGMVYRLPVTLERIGIPDRTIRGMTGREKARHCLAPACAGRFPL